MSSDYYRRGLVHWIAALSLFLVGAMDADAAPLRAGTVRLSSGVGIVWRNAKFEYQANGKRLAEVLQDFAASEGVPVIIADGVDGIVHGTFDAPPEVFLKGISETYGTLWYHDGTTLYFYPASAMQSKLFRLKGFTREQVEEMLASLNLGDRRYPLRYNAKEHTLMAYGPPRHIELVSAALESLDAGAAERDRVIVKVFPLHYASAGDRTVGGTRIPGLTTILRATYGSGTSPAETRANDPLGASRVTAKAQAMKNVFSAKGDDQGKGGVEGAVAAANASRAPETGDQQRGLRSPVSDEDSPGFEADEATNSIIVRGRISRMAEYGYLIHRLDRRPVLIELDATIIDVNSDSMASLGVDWSASGSHGSVSVSSNPGTTPESAVGAGDSSASTAAGTFTVSTLWSNSGRQLLARINALSAEGRARIVAKPKVLGVANRTAVMLEKRSAAVRVSGNLDAQLYTVEAGTQLEVTPQVDEADGATRMKLSLFIEDGQFEARAVDNVPIIKRTQIRTEAHVVEGESVLVGGISVDSQSQVESGVPGLKSIPLLGALFRWRADLGAHSERLFLITPHLVRDIDHLPPPADNQFDAFPVESGATH